MRVIKFLFRYPEFLPTFALNFSGVAITAGIFAGTSYLVFDMTAGLSDPPLFVAFLFFLIMALSAFGLFIALKILGRFLRSASARALALSGCRTVSIKGKITDTGDVDSSGDTFLELENYEGRYDVFAYTWFKDYGAKTDEIRNLWEDGTVGLLHINDSKPLMFSIDNGRYRIWL